MKALMTPIFQVPPKMAAKEAKGPERAVNGANFSSYMEGKAAARRREQNSVFGGAAEQNRISQPAARRKIPEKEGEDQAATIAGLLAEFVTDLKRAAADSEGDARPGEWAFVLPDASLMQRTAAHAGMSEAQLAALLEKTERQGGRFSLVDFLDSFARHFAGLGNEQPVTVPETDLPLLQILLERMGVPATEAARIGEKGVRGDNSLDLEKFLAALQELQGEDFTVLSQVEAEELLDMLAGAGVSRSLQRSVLPELFPVWQGEEVAGRAVLLSIDRLKNMLAQAINDAKAARLQADLPAFLDDLQEVLSQSAFQARGAGWSPVIQEAVLAVFEKLMESVDLARVRIQPGTPSRESAGLEAEAMDEAETALGGKSFPSGAGNAPGAAYRDGGQGAPGFKEQGAPFAGMAGQEQGMLASEAVVAGSGNNGNSPAQAGAARAFSFMAGMPPGLQQQTFAQLSQGVLSGLRNQEHHLVLTLYPRELGEVKVEMVVRNEQVALFFAMENSRVKEVLERNMDEFRENMERQGFILGQCLVSVDDRREGGESWQGFRAAWSGEGRARRPLSLADLDDAVLYQGKGLEGSRENGVDLFA